MFHGREVMITCAVLILAFWWWW